MSNKKYTIGLVIVAIIAVTALFTPAGQKVAGSVKGLTNTNSFGVSDMKVGTLCTDSYEYALCTGMSVDSSGNLSTTGTLQATGTIQTSSTVYAGKQNSTSTTATTYTLVSGDIVGYSVISMTPNTGALTLTLPASSTLATWLPNAGDTTEFTLFNASTTALQTITVAAGTGTLLEVGSTTGSAITAPAKASRFTVFRKWNSDLVFLDQNYF